MSRLPILIEIRIASDRHVVRSASVIGRIMGRPWKWPANEEGETTECNPPLDGHPNLLLVSALRGPVEVFRFAAWLFPEAIRVIRVRDAV